MSNEEILQQKTDIICVEFKVLDPLYYEYEEFFQENLTENKIVIFYADFMALYDNLCKTLYCDDEEGYYDTINILRKIIKLIWGNLDSIDKFPKEEFYMLLNCVCLARSECMEMALYLNNNEKFKELEENYKKLR